jgi:hypothetical protein
MEDRMKKLVMLGIIGGAAILSAVPLSLDSAEAQSALSSPTSCGYIPYGTSYAAPCGIYSSSYAIAYDRLAARAAPYGYRYARHTCDRLHRRGC